MRFINVDVEVKTKENLDLDGFESAGVMLRKNFISEQTLSEINGELDVLLKTPCFNLLHKGSIWHSNSYKEISSPTSLDSCNVLEMAIDLFYEIIPIEYQKYTVISHINIFSEKSKITLPFHSDQKRNIIKANIILRGGGVDSGLFKYAYGTHLIKHEVINTGVDLYSHHLNDNELKSIDPLICRVAAKPGDAILFDSFGFHAREECKEERRNIFIEFQDIRDSYSKISIDLNNRKLTEKVLENIKLFRPDHSENYVFGGLDKYKDGYVSLDPSPFLAIGKLFFSVFLKRLKGYFSP